MDEQDKKMVVLSDDEKALSLKSAKDLFFAVKQLHDWINDETLSEEMKETLLNLSEHYIADLSEVLHFNSLSAAKVEEKHREIREANMKIRELQKKLGENTPINGMCDLMNNLHWSLYEWWELQGFDHFSEDSFGSFGFKAKFYLGLSSFNSFSKTPVTDQKNNKTKIEQMIEDGYQIEFVQGDGWLLIDTDSNRDKIINFVKNKIPSIDITCWNNFCIRTDSNKFQLRAFEGYIRDLNDLKRIYDEMQVLKGADVMKKL